MTRAIAGRALILYDLALAAAGRAGTNRDHKAAARTHLTGAFTGRAGLGLRTGLCARSAAGVAKLVAEEVHLLFAAKGRFLKGNGDSVLEIIALNRNELLQDVLSALADIRVPIYAMNARQVENNCAVVSLTIGINNTEHLNRVVARLSKVRDVLKVTRS